MQVILLAAGKSSRLDPLSDKNLLEFGGKALIQHQIASLKKANLNEVVVVCSEHNKNIILNLVSEEKNIKVVEQKDLEEGMKGGVIAASKMITNQEVLIMNGNDVFEEDLFQEVLETVQKDDLDGVIVGKEVQKYFPGGYLKLDKEGFITDIIEKPGEGNEPSKLINLVCHLYKNFPVFLEYLTNVKSLKDDKYEVAIDDYIKKGGARIEVQKYIGKWHTIKYPWHILGLMNRFLELQKPYIDPSAEIAKTAVIEGNVVIGKNVKILHNAMIKGPVFIGEGTIIANNSLIRGSMLGKNCVVGYSTEVTRSYLNHDVWMHTNYIGDSIIDSNVSFGAGTVLGNLRFDEADIKVNIKGERISTGQNKFGAIIGSGCRFGINSSTNPGVKIGRNSFIGGGVLIEKDVENQKIVLLDQKLKIMENEKVVSMEERAGMKKTIKK